MTTVWLPFFFFVKTEDTNKRNSRNVILPGVLAIIANILDWTFGTNDNKRKIGGGSEHAGNGFVRERAFGTAGLPLCRRAMERGEQGARVG